MLLEHVDNALLRSVFDRLFAAEDEETVNNGFDELRQMGEVYAGRVAQEEQKERSELGIVRVESKSVMDDVAAEWGYQEPEPKEDDE